MSGSRIKWTQKWGLRTLRQYNNVWGIVVSRMSVYWVIYCNPFPTKFGLQMSKLEFTTCTSATRGQAERQDFEPRVLLYVPTLKLQSHFFTSVWLSLYALVYRDSSHYSLSSLAQRGRLLDLTVTTLVIRRWRQIAYIVDWDSVGGPRPGRKYSGRGHSFIRAIAKFGVM